MPQVIFVKNYPNLKEKKNYILLIFQFLTLILQSLIKKNLKIEFFLYESSIIYSIYTTACILYVFNYMRKRRVFQKIIFFSETGAIIKHEHERGAYLRSCSSRKSSPKCLSILMRDTDYFIVPGCLSVSFHQYEGCFRKKESATDKQGHSKRKRTLNSPDD